jgi:hypothetical protein
MTEPTTIPAVIPFSRAPVETGQHDQAKGKCNPNMRDASTSDVVDNDRASPCEYQREGPEAFSSEPLRHHDLHRRRLQADLVAPLLNFGPDFVANKADLFKLCDFAPLHVRRIWETPM